MNIKDATVLVTGASGGIGRAIAVAFAEKGATVLIHYGRNKKAAEETLVLVEQYGKGRIYQADLMIDTQISEMFEEIKKDGYLPTILVNNAGDARPGGIFDDRVWEYEFRNIFFSAVKMVQNFLKLSASGERQIINITSIFGVLERGDPEYLQYSAAKAAFASFTVTLSKALAPDVRVNGVAPGYTMTPAWDGVSGEEIEKLTGTTSIGRMLKPEEIADAVVSLSLDDLVTGKIVVVDGN